MARAHAAGIIHRDLKPGNVMVAEPDRKYLLCSQFDWSGADLMLIENFR